ncbi:hypothetical protein U1Q18_048505 [Sarracenia purpurea var. burkii]
MQEVARERPMFYAIVIVDFRIIAASWQTKAAAGAKVERPLLLDHFRGAYGTTYLADGVLVTFRLVPNSRGLRLRPLHRRTICTSYRAIELA